jgi:PAS domain S-box-containing protein
MDELQSILSFTRHVTSSLSPRDVIANCVINVGKILHPDHVFFFLKEEDSLRLISSWRRPGMDTCLDSRSVPVGRCLCGKTASSRAPHYTLDLSSDPSCTRDECRKAGIKSLASVPLEERGKIFGVITVASLSERDFRTQSSLLEALAGYTAFALHNSLLNEQLTRQTTALKNEVTDRERAEEALRKSNRALRMWSECHRALARSNTEKELLEQVCHSIVETGGYRMTWVGYAEHDERKTVRPVAQAGLEDGYLDGLDITWLDTEHGRGPTGTAIRSGRAVVIQDLASHPQFTPWIEAARKRGYASTISLPLVVEKHVVGVLRIYSGEPAAFNEEESKLLGELAEDLAFGIQAIRARAERQKYRESLKDLSELNQQVISCSKDGILVCGRDMRFAAWNPAMEEITGVKADDVLGRSPREAFPFLGEQQVSELFERALAGDVVSTPDFRCRLQGTGENGWAQGQFMPLKNAAGKIIGILATVHDITGRKQAEETLKESEFLFRSQFDLGNIGIAITSPDKGYVRVNGKLCQMLGYTEDEFRQRTWADMTHPDDLPENLFLFQRMMDGEIQNYEMDKRFFHKDGRTVHVRLTSSCFRNLDGSVRFIIASMLDISERKLMEQQLIESEERLRLALQAANDGLWDWHIPSGKAYFGPRYYTMLGYEPGELPASYETWRSLLHPDDLAAAEASISHALQEQGGAFGLEFRMHAKHGAWLWILSRGKVVEWGEDGLPIRMVGTHTDITELKRVKEEQERFFQLSADLLCIAGFDGYFKLISPSWVQTLGWSLEELKARPFTDFVHPDDRRSTDGARRELADGHRVQSFENRYETRNGDYRWLSWHSLASLDEGLVYAVARDVTEQKKAEEEVRRQRDFAQRIIDTSPSVIYVHDLFENKTIFTNRQVEELLGYSPPEVRRIAARWFMSIMHPEDLPRAEEHLQRLSQSREGEILEVEYRLRDKADQWHWFTSRDTVFTRTADGRVRQIVGSAQDITDRRRADQERQRLEAQVRHVQKLESLGVLAGGIAHDFNNLLMGIMGNADLAMMELPSVSPVRRNLEEIQKASSRAADLCRQMLAYSGKGRFVLDHVNLSEVIKEMANLLQISVTKNAALRYQFATDLPRIEADVTQMRQIIMNLTINASEAMGDQSGVITISTGAVECSRSYFRDAYIDESLPEGLYVYLEVADTGCGMDEATRLKMFDPFFTTKFTGRGLGLAAVLGIVRGHQGTIKVHSQPGKGTTFRVLFPAIAQQGAIKTEASADGRPWRSAGTVLLVDDEETVRTVGSQMLEKLGFHVLAARDGIEAIQIFRLRSQDIACVILDLTMPRMGGEETLRHLRQIRPSVPVIMSSGYNEQEVTQRFVDKGLAGFIQKPYDFQALRDALGKTIEKSSP